MSSLSCYCDGDYEWYYEADDYAPLPTRRSRKCCSCGARIAVGDTAMRLACRRYAKDDIERNIYGDDPDVPMPSLYLCETCADLHLSLIELGYCVNATDDRRDLVRQYAAMHSALAAPESSP